MFEHFRSFLSSERNRTTVLLIIGFIILLVGLNYLGLYEGFKSKKSKAKKAKAKKAKVTEPPPEDDDDDDDDNDE